VGSVREMTVTWGIHNEHPELDLLGNGMVTVGWDEAGDLTPLGSDRDAFKAKLAATYPDAKPGAIRIWAGVLLRFAREMAAGDIVIWPNKQDSTLKFGKIGGEYHHESGAEVQRNRRSVTWLKTGVPRAQFSQGALYEVGCAVTLFKVKNHEAEFLAFLNGGNQVVDPLVFGPVPDDSDEAATVTAEEAPNAERIETHSRDFVVKRLRARSTASSSSTSSRTCLRAWASGRRSPRPAETAGSTSSPTATRSGWNRPSSRSSASEPSQPSASRTYRS